MLKNKDKTYLDINEYFDKYDVNNESNKFKRLYKDSAEEDREKTFKKLRSDHPIRRDVFWSFIYKIYPSICIYNLYINYV